MVDAIDIISAVQWVPYQTLEVDDIFVYNMELLCVSTQNRVGLCCSGCHFHDGSDRAGCDDHTGLPDCYQKIFIKIG